VCSFFVFGFVFWFQFLVLNLEKVFSFRVEFTTDCTTIGHVIFSSFFHDFFMIFL
jgi:hypothetical protein